MPTRLLIGVLLAVAACERPETHGLDGRRLFSPPLSASARADRQARLADANRHLAQHPTAAARVWVGRRQAYLGRYRDAIATFTDGIGQDAENPRFYRHRGHRHITLRNFAAAIADLERARALIRDMPDEVEADGLPNARNTPTSTLHFNIHYHLGLACYLSGELPRALQSYRDCMKVSNNPDALCATSHWLYMTLRRQGLGPEAAAVLKPIHAGMDVIENQSYHRLLLMYKGEIGVSQLEEQVAKGGDNSGNAALAYGVANWHQYNGRAAVARKQMRKFLSGKQWAAFGYIAAEADMAPGDKAASKK